MINGARAPGHRPRLGLSGPRRNHRVTSLGAVLALLLGVFAPLGASVPARASTAAAVQASPNRFDPASRATSRAMPPALAAKLARAARQPSAARKRVIGPRHPQRLGHGAMRPAVPPPEPSAPDPFLTRPRTRD